METVILKGLYHRGQDRIGIYFEKNDALQSIVQHQAGARWSKTHRCWYLSLSKDNYIILRKSLNGKTKLRDDDLKSYLLKRKKAAPSPTIHNEYKPAMPATKDLHAKPAQPLPNHPPDQINEKNRAALQQFRQQLVLKSYSPSTARTYSNEFAHFLKELRSVAADSLTLQRIRDYLEYCHRSRGLSENTLHSRINALKFYYEQVLGRQKFFWEIPRPKKQRPIPEIFNQEEIASIINSVKNKKHKAMLMLAYSAGLRVSEVVALKTFQVDSQRMTLFISQSKGKKDRVVTLSPVLLVMLREYATAYKPKKNGYLFEGASPGAPYSTRSLQEVLASAKKKAGVMKPGSIHTLRHSFATHLIEKGTDISMIQKLLGHNDIKTTLIYLHTSNKDLLRVMSPLDDLNLK